ncbi:MAG: histidine phosphatase family protein [Nevskia sp.]|nr:histidine phosphatase family protein [Nevskia sp.]
MTTLILARHGQASFGARNYDELSPMGERQSVLLGEHWQRCGQSFDAVYSGDMVRQRGTAARALLAMSHEGQLTVDTAFNEFDHQNLIRAYLPLVARENPEIAVDRNTLFGDRKIFQRLFDLIIACWVSEREGALPVSEPWSAFQTRCLDGLRRIGESGAQRVVVFTSGGVITAALQAALHLESAAAFRLNWHILNASVHTFKLGERGAGLLRFNDIAHLELAQDPGLLTYR